MQRRYEIIALITTDKSYVDTCKHVSTQYHQDIFQEVCELILTIPEEKLPKDSYLKFWFYCVARNIMSNSGKFGRNLHKEMPLDDLSIFHCIADSEQGEDFTHAEDKMLQLSEFENRVAILFVKHGDMKKVQRATGISYSALREVKEKIKQLRCEY
jgi:hypothetical protein